MVLHGTVKLLVITNRRWTITIVNEKHALKVADTCWVALASLHRQNSDRKSFSASEVLDYARDIDGEKPRPGLQPHVYQHIVANLPRQTGAYRMFFQLPDKSLRLYRPGDHADPSRTGKIKPEADDLPPEYRDLLRWYDEEYCKSLALDKDDDPILAIRGLGKHLWKDESGEEFLKRERSDW